MVCHCCLHLGGGGSSRVPPPPLDGGGLHRWLFPAAECSAEAWPRWHCALPRSSTDCTCLSAMLPRRGPHSCWSCPPTPVRKCNFLAPQLPLATRPQECARNVCTAAPHPDTRATFALPLPLLHVRIHLHPWSPSSAGTLLQRDNLSLPEKSPE